MSALTTVYNFFFLFKGTGLEIAEDQMDQKTEKKIVQVLALYTLIYFCYYLFVLMFLRIVEFCV